MSRHSTHTTPIDARRVTSQPKCTQAQAQGQDRKEGTGQRYTPSFLVRRLSFISPFNFVAKDTHVWMLCAAPPGTGAEPTVACCCCCFTGVLIRCIRCIRCIRSRRHVAPEMRVVVGSQWDQRCHNASTQAGKVGCGRRRRVAASERTFDLGLCLCLCLCLWLQYGPTVRVMPPSHVLHSSGPRCPGHWSTGLQR